MKIIMNRLRLIILFGMWLCFNPISSGNSKLKIIYSDASIETVFDITPQFFNEGMLKGSLDSIIVDSGSLCVEFLNKINALKEINDEHRSIDVRGKIIFYQNDQVYDVCYLDMFYVFHKGRLYKIDEGLKKMVNTAIRKRRKKSYMF